jgi:hypothetical protein
LKHSGNRQVASTDQCSPLWGDYIATESNYLAGTPRQRAVSIPYFDVYPIETSTNLADCTPLTTLMRANLATNALVYLFTVRKRRIGSAEPAQANRKLKTVVCKAANRPSP